VKRLALLVTLSLMYGDDSFITPYEYGQMLYDSPRGIGCVHCHGIHGEGAKIATYKENEKTVELRGPDIRKVSIGTLKKSLVEWHRVMPTYFLTDSEIKVLYNYLRTPQEPE